MWKKQGGGKAVEVDKTDLLGLTWMKIPRSNQLGVRTRDGLYYKFTGFRDQVACPNLFVGFLIFGAFFNLISKSIYCSLNRDFYYDANWDYSSMYLLDWTSCR